MMVASPGRGIRVLGGTGQRLMSWPWIPRSTKLAAHVGVAVQLCVVDWTSMAAAETRSTTGAGGVPCGMIPTSATWEQPLPPVSGPALNVGVTGGTCTVGLQQLIGVELNVALALSSSTLTLWINGLVGSTKFRAPEAALCGSLPGGSDARAG